MPADRAIPPPYLRGVAQDLITWVALGGLSPVVVILLRRIPSSAPYAGRIALALPFMLTLSTAVPTLRADLRQDWFVLILPFFIVFQTLFVFALYLLALPFAVAATHDWTPPATDPLVPGERPTGLWLCCGALLLFAVFAASWTFRAPLAESDRIFRWLAIPLWVLALLATRAVHDHRRSAIRWMIALLGAYWAWACATTWGIEEWTRASSRACQPLALSWIAVAAATGHVHFLIRKTRIFEPEPNGG